MFSLRTPLTGIDAFQVQLRIFPVKVTELVQIGPGRIVNIVHSQADTRRDRPLATPSQGRGQIAAMLGQVLHPFYPVLTSGNGLLGDGAEPRLITLHVIVPDALPYLAGIVH